MATDNDKFWIIWNPTHWMPPSTRFASYAQAKAVARKMASDNKGYRFYVLEASDYYEVTPVSHKKLS